MAKVGAKRQNAAPVVQRISPLKPGLRGARNWATAQVRAAGYSKRGFWRLCLSLIVLAVMTVMGSLWLGGFLPDTRQVADRFTRNSLMSLGFVVERIDIVGEGRIREQDVRAALGVNVGDYLFEMDLEDAQERVESLSWVELAVVRRLWPDRIVVQIIERRPYALWQHQGQIQLVDITGEIIADGNPVDFMHLPLVIGEGAQSKVIHIQSILEPFGIVKERVNAMTLMPNGRWDLLINHGETKVRLPVENPQAALRKLETLHQDNRLLDRKIEVIDLRLPDRLTLRPRPSKPV